MSSAALLGWAAGVGGAASLKMASSIDDVVWLAPFLTANSSWTQRLRNSVIYTVVCMSQTCIAFLIAYSGDAAVEYITRNNEDAWSTEKILTVAAGSMLAVYAVKLTYEYIQEWREGGDDDNDKKPEENDPKHKYTPAATAESQVADVEGGTGISKAEKLPDSARRMEIDGSPEKGSPADEKKDEDGRSQTLFVIAFIGSVDDLTLFVPMLVGKGFNIVQLMIGSFLAVVTIVLICVFLGLCKPFADFVEKIPLALIVVIFASYLLGKSFFMT
eukprot:gnl/MRDRNA2_/MRDRNA2_77007_c0_seq2.p1 gnl/MRDRNA2_/MRDRNA2_77007_c0~~gnl/MRDRNA2_/MRDRNA2_77007_c0_seq2.p1  ORF type:complete len:273 (-),score=49.93 gnl/MRDRNA2_/MRDRNA2_77007_c0_seq2:379-1197(-)